MVTKSIGGKNFQSKIRIRSSRPFMSQDSALRAAPSHAASNIRSSRTSPCGMDWPHVGSTGSCSSLLPAVTGNKSHSAQPQHRVQPLLFSPVCHSWKEMGRRGLVAHWCWDNKRGQGRVEAFHHSRTTLKKKIIIIVKGFQFYLLAPVKKVGFKILIKNTEYCYT